MSDHDETETEFQAAYDAGLAFGDLQHKPRWVGAPGDGRPFAVVRDKQGNETVVSLTNFTEPIPDWLARKANATFRDVASFCSYVSDYREDSYLLMADPATSVVSACLDYHQPGVAGARGLRQHVADLKLKHDPAWSAWAAVDGKALSQVAFAEFLEDRLAEIAEPDGAAVLEAATNLQSKKDVEFASALNLTNGAVQFTFNETVENKGKGKLTVPDRLTLALPVYEHGENVRLNVRLRYRINDQKLTFIVKLHRPDLAQREAFAAVLAAVEAGVGMKPLLGSVA